MIHINEINAKGKLINVKIGANNHLYANCVIGRTPQLLGMDENSPMGGLVIGDNNVIILGLDAKNSAILNPPEVEEQEEEEVMELEEEPEPEPETAPVKNSEEVEPLDFS